MSDAIQLNVDLLCPNDQITKIQSTWNACPFCGFDLVSFRENDAQVIKYARLCAQAERYLEAGYYYQQLCKKNHADALLEYGIFFEKGLGLSRNLKSAFAYYEKAASLKNVNAIVKIADMYRFVKPNTICVKQKALKYYIEAKSRGHKFTKEKWDDIWIDCCGFTEDGYDYDGYDRNGYDRHGYDRHGYDRHGYDRNGMSRYHVNVYDRNGFDREEYKIDGYNTQGYDCDSCYDSDGYDFDGFDRDGFDRYGFDREGFDHYGFDRDERNSYYLARYNSDGEKCDSFDLYYYDHDSYGSDAYVSDGYDLDF